MKTSRKLLALLLAVLLLGAFALPVSAAKDPLFDPMQKIPEMCVHCWLDQPLSEEMYEVYYDEIYHYTKAKEESMVISLKLKIKPSSQGEIGKVEKMNWCMVTKVPTTIVSFGKATLRDYFLALHNIKFIACTPPGSTPTPISGA